MTLIKINMGVCVCGVDDLVIVFFVLVVAGVGG